ncbi:hypothetical protein RRG08_058016 [Elysia crispata]|uniref:Uncharacterized protein n=1 Tax=Elysia crispata TaxID=231223 RepID=A0AAE1APM9_9GAST|nr:hypothetical protein RRG08_058016 [Elysia crispata]
MKVKELLNSDIKELVHGLKRAADLRDFKRKTFLQRSEVLNEIQKYRSNKKVDNIESASRGGSVGSRNLHHAKLPQTITAKVFRGPYEWQLFWVKFKVVANNSAACNHLTSGELSDILGTASTAWSGPGMEKGKTVTSRPLCSLHYKKFKYIQQKESPKTESKLTAEP